PRKPASPWALPFDDDAKRMVIAAADAYAIKARHRWWHDHLPDADWRSECILGGMELGAGEICPRAPQLHSAKSLHFIYRAVATLLPKRMYQRMMTQRRDPHVDALS